MHNVTLACQFCGTKNKVDVSRFADKPKCAECQRPFLLDRPVHVREENFDTTVLGSEVPVLVDFYADWCGPCRMMAPALDDVAHELAGAIVVAKVDTDASPALSQRYDIKGIPFLARFEGGKMTKSATGALDRKSLLELVKAS